MFPISLIKSKLCLYMTGGALVLGVLSCGALGLKLISANNRAEKAQSELLEYQRSAAVTITRALAEQETLKAKQEKEKNDLNRAHKERVAGLRAYYDARLRHGETTNLGGHTVSVLPETTGGADEAAAHLRSGQALGKLQGDCAVTTQMLLDLQEWVQKQ